MHIPNVIKIYKHTEPAELNFAHPSHAKLP